MENAFNFTYFIVLVLTYTIWGLRIISKFTTLQLIQYTIWGLMIISKFTTLQRREQTIAQYLRKYNQSDNKIWSINRIYLGKYFFLLKNHIQNVLEKLLPYPFLENKIEHISVPIILMKIFIQFVFIVYPGERLWKYINVRVQTTCFYLL